jgi:O-antigen ligase
LNRFAKSVLWLEPLLVAAIIIPFWVLNQDRVWALLLVVPILLLRVFVLRRVISNTPLNWLFLAFLTLCLLSVYTAPFSIGLAQITFAPLNLSTSIPYTSVLIARILMGMTLFFVLVEYARLTGKIEANLVATTLLALVVAVLTLGATQWNDKSDQLRFIIDRLPVLTVFPGFEKGANANELAGALAWLTPLMGGLALYKWRSNLLRVGVTAAFWLLLLALFLGQSRLAILGVFAALAVLIFLLIPRGRRRKLALAGLALFFAAEAVVVTNVLNPEAAESVQARDEVSNLGRLDMWKAALAIVRDHPLTGVGMNMYRMGNVRAVYPVPGYERRGPPHAHNEFFQVATDLGLPGLAVFVGWYVVAGWMLLQIWRRGDSSARVVAAAIGAGLLAHAIFGFGDAIALWDRFIFVFWWLLGLAGAQYNLVQSHRNVPQGIDNPEISAQIDT